MIFAMLILPSVSLLNFWPTLYKLAISDERYCIGTVPAMKNLATSRANTTVLQLIVSGVNL